MDASCSEYGNMSSDRWIDCFKAICGDHGEICQSL
jgi:hypothetical protein